ncbi:hypothetical protein [Mycobacterium paraintracellulare]|uniref:hypothetical protein n=1 Tax=Mycobacterium paraintracellulare TaxID=1138383 RepID=UPI001916A50F|nr:hypothetical protein [Mycobacterium paraintracellulare]
MKHLTAALETANALTTTQFDGAFLGQIIDAMIAAAVTSLTAAHAELLVLDDAFDDEGGA